MPRALYTLLTVQEIAPVRGLGVYSVFVDLSFTYRGTPHSAEMFRRSRRLALPPISLVHQHHTLLARCRLKSSSAPPSACTCVSAVDDLQREPLASASTSSSSSREQDGTWLRMPPSTFSRVGGKPLGVVNHELYWLRPPLPPLVLERRRAGEGEGKVDEWPTGSPLRQWSREMVEKRMTGEEDDGEDGEPECKSALCAIKVIARQDHRIIVARRRARL
ncbi:hypothetical protein B0H19DRAFT_433678 [Mycena capillaripes]|nr:hypothetical protein B0H19DRAFT_433678 [Mycena capillaripes]